MARDTSFERFFTRIGPAPYGDCILWTGALTPRGYGVFKERSYKRVLVHRWAFELVNGPIGSSAPLDHLCHTRDSLCPGGDICWHRRCIRPTHLEIVTNAENVRRGGQRLTHCKRGHEFTPANTYIRNKGNGVRQCRRCHADQELERRALRGSLVLSS